MEHSVSRVKHHGYQLYHQICSYTSTGQLACSYIAGKQKVLNMIWTIYLFSVGLWIERSLYCTGALLVQQHGVNCENYIAMVPNLKINHKKCNHNQQENVSASTSW